MSTKIPVYARAYDPATGPYAKKGRPTYMNPGTLATRPGAVAGVYLNLGIDSFIDEVTSQGRSAASKKISAIAGDILAASQYYCPVDEGDLLESGTVVETGVGADKEAQVRYRTRYALYVHENLSAYHEPPTQAKYLEQAYIDVIYSHTDTPMKSHFDMEVRTFASRSRRSRKRVRNQENTVIQRIGKRP